MRVDPCARVTTLTDTRMAIMKCSRARKAQVAARLRPRTAFLLEPRGARTRPPRLRVVLVPAPCPCPGVLLLVCYSNLARALLVPTRARATLCLLLLVRYSFATRPLLARYS